MKLFSDYAAMRRLEMDEIRQRNPEAVPELGYVFGAIGVAAFIAVPIVVWHVVFSELWPTMIKEWPFPGVLDAIFIAAFVLVYMSAFVVAALSTIIDVSDRIQKFRKTSGATNATNII